MIQFEVVWIAVQPQSPTESCQHRHTRTIACDTLISYYRRNDYIFRHSIQTPLTTLLKSPTAARPLLEEPVRVIPLTGLRRLLLRGGIDPAPVILAVICVVHEQWPIHVWQIPGVDVLLDQVAHALVQVLVRLVDLLVVACEGVGEVELDEDVVGICRNIEEILSLLLALGLFYSDE